MPTVLKPQFIMSITRNSIPRELHKGQSFAQLLLVILLLLPCALAMTAAAQLPGLPKIEPPKLPQIPSLPSVTPPPATKTPATKTPATKTPATKTPATKTPATKTPATKTPATKTPATKTPATKTPAPPSVPDGSQGGKAENPAGRRQEGSKADEQSKARPQFAPLVTKECIASLEELDSPAREVLQQVLSAFASADRGPAPLQLAYASEVAEMLRNCSTPSSNEHTPPRQLAAIEAARKLAQDLQEKGLPYLSPRDALLRELKTRALLLQTWIDAEPGRKGTDLTFASKGGKGRLAGVRTIEWGAIPGWTDDVVRLSFDDGIVFERQSESESIPMGIGTVFVPSNADWLTSVPPVDAMGGSVDVFLSKRPVAGTNGVVIVQKLLIVDGRLLAALTAMQGGTNEELVTAAQQQWAALVKDLGTVSEGLERAEAGKFLATYFTWADDRGTVTAATINEIPDDLAGSFVLKSKDYTFAVNTCTAIRVDDSVRVGVREWTFDDMDLTPSERAAIVPANGQFALVLECVAVGVDLSKFCKPIVTLVDAQGRTFQEVGDEGRDGVLKGLRGNHINKGGSGNDIAFDFSSNQLARAQYDGMSATHGPRARVFFVSADATGLVAKLADCQQSIPIPMINSGVAFSRMPICVQRATTFSESTAGKNPNTVSLWYRQWGHDCIVQAEAAKRVAAQKEADITSKAEAATRAAELERKKKLESAFE